MANQPVKYKRLHRTDAYRAPSVPDEVATIIVEPEFDHGFWQQIDADQEHATNILKTFADALQAGGFAEEQFCKDIEYIVKMPDETKAAIENGEIVLDQNKLGETYAQFRNGSKYGKKLPIEKVIKDAGLNPVEVGQALQLKAMQRQLQQMSAVLNDISHDISEVMTGQQNDRIGFYYSGLNQAMEAMNIQDETFRKFMLAQAIKTLSDSCAQVTLQMESSIKSLETKEYSKKKGNTLKEIEKTMATINQSFEIIHKAFELKTYIYYRQKEFSAMIQAIDQYSLLLQSDIIPNQMLLRECDPNDTVLVGGKWDQRVQSLLALKEKRQQLLELTENTPLRIEEVTTNEG